MTINPVYHLQQLVYLKTDPEQLVGMVTAIKVTPYCLLYQVSHGEKSDYFYDFELQTEKIFF